MAFSLTLEEAAAVSTLPVSAFVAPQWERIIDERLVRTSASDRRS
jgi:hypothetical protein